MTKPFSRFVKTADLAGEKLEQAATAVVCGDYDADLGGSVFKQRVARHGEGKSSGFRTILSYRVGGHVFFVHGFAKSAKANISEAELAQLRRLAGVYAGYSQEELQTAVAKGKLIEIVSHDRQGKEAV